MTAALYRRYEVLKEQNDEHSTDRENFFRYRQGVGETLRIEKVERRGQGLIMTIRKVEVEQFSMTTSKPFEAVVVALEAAVGHPDIGEYFRATNGARTFAELESAVQGRLGRTGLMMFLELDQGALLRRETGFDTPKVMRFVIGNPLIMKEMAKHVPDAGSYAPVTVLVDEQPDGVHLYYDKMASLLAPYRNPDVLAVARDLDAKVEALLTAAAS